jgi:hypothetical protein
MNIRLFYKFGFKILCPLIYLYIYRMKTKHCLSIPFLVCTFFACKPQQITTTNSNEVTVVGKAEHAKLGAIVITKNGTYYIEGKANWDKEGYYKKEIRVTGILETRTNSAESLKNEKGEYIQGAVGEIHYIKMNKCELVK